MRKHGVMIQMVQQYELNFTLTQLKNVVSQVLATCKDSQVITLSGTLGAGKTTFAIELLRQLGVSGEMQSPTYTYMQMYQNDASKNFYHFDLYRLQHKDDFLFAGFDEFLYQPNGLVLIEWPEIIVSLLDKNLCAIRLDYVDNVTRKITWEIA